MTEIESIIIDGQKLYYDPSDPATALLPFIARLYKRIEDIEDKISALEDRTGGEII